MRKLLISLLLIPPTFITAQSSVLDSDQRAKEILEQLAASINAHVDLTYQFKLTIAYPETEPEMINGTYQQRGTNYRLETPGYQFVSNGKSKWVIDVEGKEIQIHDFVASEGGDIADPQALLNIYANPHYAYRLLYEGTQHGKEVQIIEFKPLERTGEMAKATLTIDKESFQMSSMEVINKDGSKLHLIIEDIQSDMNLPDDHFIVVAAKFPSFHFEDLRIE